MTSDPFVSTEWLSEHMFDPNLRVVDGSWYLPAMQREAEAEFLAAHIPGAVRFDPDTIADTTSPLPHMVARPEEFAKAVGALGISETDTIVVYDGAGLFSAARVWWNFKAMSARSVRVLDGGLPKWVAEGRPLAQGASDFVPARFTAELSPDAVADAEQVSAALDDGETQVIDVRPAARFVGEAPEPRPGLASGHMPGALNLPFSLLIENGRMKPADALRAIFADAGIDLTAPVISSCGSGVTAPLVNLALARLGVDAPTIYDGSWAEWGSCSDLPVVKG